MPLPDCYIIMWWIIITESLTCRKHFIVAASEGGTNFKYVIYC